MEGLEVVAVVVGIIILWGVIYWHRSERLLRKYGAKTHFAVGKYVVGLEGRNYPTADVECVVTSNDLVFSEMGGAELGRIPRNSVEEVVLDDKSRITQRLTATRMVALGVFALAAPKKEKTKEWCVGVRWVDGKGLKRATIFEFAGSNPEGPANEAAMKVMKYMRVPVRTSEALGLGKSSSSSASLKMCPYCGESIKAAAIICRFCNRELPKDAGGATPGASA